MNEVIFAGDESGDKRFADKPESTRRQIGVFAGVLIPKAKEANIRKEMDAIAAKFPPPAGEKHHIASLPKAEADACRQAVFDLIRESKLVCVFGAISTQGFHEEFTEQQDVVEQAKKALPSNIADLNPKLKPDRLHSKAFEEAFANAVGYCLDSFGDDKPVLLDVRTDQLEQAILKEFAIAATGLLEEPLDGKQEFKFYDKTAKTPVTRVTQSSFIGGEAYGPIRNVKATFAVENGSLTFLADVIANNFYDHLRKKFEDDPLKELNSVSSFDGHPLRENVYGPSNGQPALSDVIYQHPDCSEVTIEDVEDDLLTEKEDDSHG